MPGADFETGIGVVQPPEESIHRIYDRIQATQIDRRRGGRTNTMRSLRDILISPAVIEELQRVAFRLLSEEQREINRKGLAEVRQKIASLEGSR